MRKSEALSSIWLDSVQRRRRSWEKLKKEDLFPPESVHRFHRVLRLANFRPNDIVLDIGSGPSGGLAAYASNSKLSEMMIAIDPLIGMKNFAMKRMQAIRCVGEALPVHSESVDCIVCINALDHVENPDHVVREIWRCLRSSGSFYLMVHIVPPVQKLFHSLLKLGRSRLKGRLYSTYELCLKLPAFLLSLLVSKRVIRIFSDLKLHPHYFTMQSLIKFLKLHGFTVRKLFAEESKWGYKRESYFILEKPPSAIPNGV